jgi:hypothetical protein
VGVGAGASASFFVHVSKQMLGDVKKQQKGNEATASWDWSLDGHSLALSVRFVPDDNAAVKQLDEVKLDAKAASVRQEIALSAPGTLAFTFDNSFSYLRGKTARFRLQPASLHEGWTQGELTQRAGARGSIVKGINGVKGLFW